MQKIRRQCSASKRFSAARAPVLTEQDLEPRKRCPHGLELSTLDTENESTLFLEPAPKTWIHTCLRACVDLLHAALNADFTRPQATLVPGMEQFRIQNHLRALDG